MNSCWVQIVEMESFLHKWTVSYNRDSGKICSKHIILPSLIEKVTEDAMYLSEAA